MAEKNTSINTVNIPTVGATTNSGNTSFNIKPTNLHPSLTSVVNNVNISTINNLSTSNINVINNINTINNNLKNNVTIAQRAPISNTVSTTPEKVPMKKSKRIFTQNCKSFNIKQRKFKLILK